MAKGEFY